MSHTAFKVVVDFSNMIHRVAAREETWALEMPESHLLVNQNLWSPQNLLMSSPGGSGAY